MTGSAVLLPVHEPFRQPCCTGCCAYNIGTGEWKDTSIVADDVQIKFHVVAAGK